MLFRIAWRNIWRNKLRSIILMLSVAVGLWAGMFIMSFSWGLYTEHIHDVIESQLSHIQIHHPGFKEEKLAEYTVSDSKQIKQILLKDDRVKGVTGRNVVEGMISSSSYAAGVNIYGIKPEEEYNVSTVHKTIIRGSTFTSGKRYEIMIGEKLAEKLDVDIKNKIVLTFQGKNQEITAGAFKVTGIFRTQNSAFDEMNVYTRFDDLAQLLGTGEEVHEIAILLKSDDKFEEVAKELKSNYAGKLKVETWKELAPELQLIIDSFYQYMYIFIAIILLALMFGIINTMLMAVLERQHEFGMLMAIGMNKGKIFTMIVLETLLLTCIGIPLGILFTYVTVEYFNKNGIDVSYFSKGLARFGLTTVIHPYLEPFYYLPISLMTAGAAILSAIYPAIKALRLKPAEAIRKI